MMMMAPEGASQLEQINHTKDEGNDANDEADDLGYQDEDEHRLGVLTTNTADSQEFICINLAIGRDKNKPIYFSCGLLAYSYAHFLEKRAVQTK